MREPEAVQPSKHELSSSPRDARAEARALLEKWRAEYAEGSSAPHGDAWDAGWFNAIDKCADELEPILHALLSEGTQEETDTKN